MKATVMMAALAAAFLATSQMAAFAEDADGDETEEAAPKKAKKVKKAPSAPSKMFVAVYDFENKSSAGDNDVKTIRDRITGAIVNTRKFEVVERERIKTLMKELNLAASGVTDGEDAPKAGKSKAAGYGIYGCVLSYGQGETRASSDAVSGATFESKVELQIRISNVETGKILTDQIIQCSGDLKKVASGNVQQSGNFGEQAMRNAVDAACREAVFLLLDQAYPVKVLSVGDEDITLNVNKDLVKEDDVFNIYEAPEYEEDPDTHEMIPVDGKQIGRVAITEVGAKTSKAEPVEWIKVRGKGKKMKVKKMEACEIDSIEKGMILRKVSAATLAKEKVAEKAERAGEFENRF